MITATVYCNNCGELNLFNAEDFALYRKLQAAVVELQERLEESQKTITSLNLYIDELEKNIPKEILFDV